MNPKILACALITIALGCDVVDESDIKESDLDFLAACVADEDLAVGNTLTPRRIDFSLYENRRSTSAAGCGLQGLKGPEGYFLFEALEEQRWQILATPTGNADVALYIDNKCDQTNCQAAKDRCGPGLPESFTFASAPGTGTSLYSLVVDTHEAYSGTIDVVLVSSTCANDTLEPGEGCLPGSEGCSFATCQSEIPLKTDVLGVEHEPNDDITQSNLVRLPNPDEFVAPVSINGKVGGGCDDDILELDFSSAQSVATGRVLKVTAGAGCENRPGLIVTIVSDLNGRKIDVANGAEVQGSCPTVTEEMVSNRNYYIKVRAMDDAVPQFDYTLNVELEPVEGI